MKILVVDDDKEIVQLLEIYVKNEGYEPVAAYNGKEALTKLNTTPDIGLVILDLMMPEMDGMEVIKQLRKDSAIPVLILSAKTADMDKIQGLISGADDYVTKPFSAITLIARIKALYRRSQLAKQPAEQPGAADRDFDVKTKNFRMNTKTREVFLYDQQIGDLTPKEFDLLKTLASKPRQVFTREQLLQLVWDYEYYGDERTVDAHIKKLRQKLEDLGPQVIKTVWGVGYKFDDEAD